MNHRYYVLEISESVAEGLKLLEFYYKSSNYVDVRRYFNVASIMINVTIGLQK